MLAEERLAKILSFVDAKGTVTVTELMDELNISESTIRRDLLSLDREGRLNRVRGGATSKKGGFFTQDDSVSVRMGQNVDSKMRIGAYAASLVTDNDFVYIDAGTTTAQMIPYLTARGATYVTNSLPHAMSLASTGFNVAIIGGEFKSLTEAIIGEEAIESLLKYNFTKGFFGANGVSEKKGFTTPEMKEAMIKRVAMQQCKESFVLCDNSKFDVVAAVTFGKFDDSTIITDNASPDYRRKNNIIYIESKEEI